MRKVASILPDLSLDTAARLWEDVFVPELSVLIHSQSSAEKLGGLLAIGEHSLENLQKSCTNNSAQTIWSPPRLLMEIMFACTTR